jgi:predicted O-methyltransferase YrrM
LVQAFSTAPAARQRIAEQEWDAIYIDGNHDYEVAKADWELCAARIRTGGMVVLDDSALDTGYRAPAFATAGHPGPSRVAGEIDGRVFSEVLRVGHNRVFRKLA